MRTFDTKIRVKIYFLLGLFSLASLGLMLSAFGHQVVQRDRYLAWAEQQQLEPVRLIPLRGRIVDSRGNLMAMSLKAGSVFAHPASIEDPASVARRLSIPMDTRPVDLAARMKKDVSFVWLARQIPLDRAEEIRGMRLAGVGVEKEGIRYYPNRELAGQVLGFTGIDSKGLEGLEWAFDRYLRGPEGRLFMQRDALGRTLWQEIPEKPGGNAGSEIRLTLDTRIQYFAERTLGEAVRESGARFGTAVAMDPRSGEILAMACAPTFNPNNFRGLDPSRWKNRSITDAFEPGSTIKALTVAAAMEEGLVQEDTEIDCEKGLYRYGGRLIHDLKPRGLLSVREILGVSSNIGIAKIADMMSPQSHWNYLDAFGFGRKTGIDLPGESPGSLREWKGWYKVATATQDIGQGFSETTLQLACAFSAVANGGFLIEPYVVGTVLDSRGNALLQRQPREGRRILSKRTADRVLGLMEYVVREGTGKAARIPCVRVGGKTGTAQKFDTTAGTYSDERKVVSFVGVLPVEDPQLVIAVVLDEPGGDASGGNTAAPAFRRIAEACLYYRRVPVPAPAVVAESAVGIRFCSASTDVRRELRRQQPLSFGPAVLGAGQWQMPELRRRPLRSAFRAMDGMPVAIRLEGSGLVVDQDPMPGYPLAAGQTVVLRANPGGENN